MRVHPGLVCVLTYVKRFANRFRRLAPFVDGRSVGGVARVVPVVRRIRACRDPKDDKFLDVALSGDAAAIITGDQDLLVLDPFHGIRIVSPSVFLTWV